MIVCSDAKQNFVSPACQKCVVLIQNPDLGRIRATIAIVPDGNLIADLEFSTI